MTDVPHPAQSPIEHTSPAESPRPAFAPWLDAAVGGALGVGAAVVAAIPVVLGGLIWLSTSEAASTPFGSNVSIGGLGPVAAVLWVAVLSLGGQVSVSLGASAFGASTSIGSGTVAFFSMLVFIAAVGATAWWSHRVERRHPSERGLILWLTVPVSGASAGVLALLLGAVAQGSISAGPVSLQASGLTVGSFFGPFVVVSLAAAAGRWLARNAALRRLGFFRALWDFPARLRWGTRDVFDYVAAVTVTFTLAATIIGLFRLGGALPVALGQLTVALVCLGTFGGIATQASVPWAPAGSSSTTLSTFSSEVIGVTWLLVILALLCTFVSAVVIANRRDAAAHQWRTAWMLPVSTIVASAALGSLFGTASASGTASALGMTAPLSASIAPTWWTYLVAGMWGLSVELLARYVAPMVITAVPALARLRIGAATATAPPPDTSTDTTE